MYKLRRQQTKSLIRKSKSIKLDSFLIYEPLVADLRKDSHAALFNNFIIMIRRLTLLFLAMFIVGHPFVQVLIFMLMNLFSLGFIITVMPYAVASNNYQNLLNEVISLLVSYFVVQINDQRYEPETKEVMGGYVVYLI